MSQIVKPPFPSCDLDDDNFVFVSYSHEDRGRVYEVLQELKALHANVWYDDGISGVESWPRTLVSAISNSSRFIVMLTPNAVNSENVMREVALASDERKPILMVYLEEAQLRDDLRFHLAGRQGLYRYDSDTETFERRLRKFLENFSSEDHVEPEPEPAPPQPGGVVQVQPAEPPPPHTPRMVVDKAGGAGVYTSISAAVEEASSGDTILVRAGIYEEELRISQPLDLIGEGNPGNVVVWSRDADVVVWTAEHGALRNMTVEQTGVGGEFSGIVIDGGQPTISGCVISSTTGHCVVVSNEARATLRNNYLSSSHIGLSVLRGGFADVEDCFIESHELCGVEVRKAEALLRHNDIARNGQSGIFVGDGGTATVEENRISDNDEDGAEVTSGSEATVLRNVLSKNKGAGVKVTYMGHATVRGNCFMMNRRGRFVGLMGSELKASGNDAQAAELPDAGVRIDGESPGAEAERRSDGIGAIVFTAAPPSDDQVPIPPLRVPGRRGRK